MWDEPRSKNCTGLAQIVGQLSGSNRDFQSKCWAKSRNWGQPCRISVQVGVGWIDRFFDGWLPTFVDEVRRPERGGP